MSLAPAAAEPDPPITVVCLGDSTTAPRGDLDIYANRIARKFPQCRIVNAGVGGSTTQSARARFESDVLAAAPHLVIIQFGINDASVNVWKDPPAEKPAVSVTDFEGNLRHFVGTLKAQGAGVILMTPNQIRWTDKLKELYGKPPYDRDDDRGFTVVLASYAEAVRRVAASMQVPLVDVYALYDDWERKSGRSCDSLLLDGMHPGPAGQELVANALVPVLSELLARTPDGGQSSAPFQP